MTLTVGQVWNRARDQHPALSALNAPFPLACRRVADDQRELVNDITAAVPAFLQRVLEVSLPLADFAAGVDLSTEIPGGWVDFRQGSVQYSSGGEAEAFSIPWDQRLLPTRLPAYTFQGNVLYFVGPERSYSQASTFRLPYTALVADPTALSSVLTVPDDARNCLALMLAGFYLMRLVSEPMWRVTEDLAVAKVTEGQKARAAFIHRITRVGRGQRHVMRNVGPRP